MRQSVEFDEIACKIKTLWSSDNDCEIFCCEIFWNCLVKKNLTNYVEEKEQAAIHIYPHVINMLLAEFSCFMFDLAYSYEFEFDYEDNVLTGVALEWLYRDNMQRYSTADVCHTNDPNEMLTALVFENRHIVADAVFEILGTETVFFLLYYSAVSPYVDGECQAIVNFKSAEMYLDYCRKQASTVDYTDFFENDTERESNILHWLSCHSCAIDD